MGRRIRTLVVAATAVALASGCQASSHPALHSRPRPHGNPIAASSTPVSRSTPTAVTSTRRGSRSTGANAVSFVSATRGWALRAGVCSGCAEVLETVDAGRDWRVVSHPPLLSTDRQAIDEGVYDLRFTDRTDGYLWTSYRCARNCLLITHDGGATWQRTSLPPIAQLVTGGGATVALTATDAPALLRNDTGTSGWTTLALPAPLRTGRPHWTEQSLTIAASGRTLALLERTAVAFGATADQLGRLWISTDGGSAWEVRAVPCTVADGGAALVGLSPDTDPELLLDCYENNESQQEQQTQHHLYSSTDLGNHWQRRADPSDTGVPTLLVDAGGGHAFLAVESGVADALNATFDAARSWRPVITDGDGFFGWGDLEFVDAHTGFLLGPTHYAPEHLYRTTDGGRSWRQLPLPAR